MKVKSLKGMVTLEMDRETAKQVAAAISNRVNDLLIHCQKDRQAQHTWADLAILGRVRDCLDKHLGLEGR